MFSSNFLSFRINSWSDIDNLSNFPTITALRISQVPLFHLKGASEVRPFVIARIEKLTVLNGSVISPRERKDSEKIYLRSVLMEKMKIQKETPSKPEEEIHQSLALLNPRYLVLRALYEAELCLPSALSGGVVGTEKNLAAEMIAINLKNMIITSSAPSEPMTKKLPLSLTIGKLRLVIKQLFHVDPSNQILALRCYKDSIPLELDDDSSTLQYYGAIDGADVFINEK
jgi:hypothetical protein